jgi:hypothetical protein
MSKIFDMQEQLAIGNKGEELFLSFYPDLKRLDGRKGDFIGHTNRKIELKTDSYTTSSTSNFFMERYRNDKGAPGGPWQALEHDVYYFVYLFSDGIVYWFRTSELVKYLEENEAKFEKRKIFNKGWSAVGYLVPRMQTEPVIIRKERLYERTSE